MTTETTSTDSPVSNKLSRGTIKRGTVKCTHAEYADPSELASVQALNIPSEQSLAHSCSVVEVACQDHTSTCPPVHAHRSQVVTQHMPTEGVQLASITHTKQPVISSNYTTTVYCDVGPVGNLPSWESDLLDSPALSVHKLVFDWFGAAPDSATLLPTFTPPPSPLVFRQSLLSFWPTSLAKE